MAPPRQLYLLISKALLLSLAIVCTALLAQPASESSAESTQGSQQEKADSGETTPDPKTEDVPAGSNKDSPFDYRSSEEISEDLPVSFPVDI